MGRAPTADDGRQPAPGYGVADGARDARMVQIHIWIETTQPPTGRVVTVEGQPAKDFAGWLQLLSILASALQPPSDAPLTRPGETAP